MNSRRLAVVRRRVVHSLGQELKADKLQVGIQSLVIYVETIVWIKKFKINQKPGRRRSIWRAAVRGCGPSKKQRDPPLIECSGTLGRIPSTSPRVSLKTRVQSGAVAGMGLLHG